MADRPKREDFPDWNSHNRALCQWWADQAGIELIDHFDRVPAQRKMDECLVPWCPECYAGTGDGTPVRGLTSDRSECAEDGTLVWAVKAPEQEPEPEPPAGPWMGARSATVALSWTTTTKAQSDAIAELWSEFIVEMHGLARGPFEDLDSDNPDVILCDVTIKGDIV